jgi:DNA polymerase III alpha subunit
MRVRTGYSFKTAIGHLDKVFERLVELKYPAFPITDRMSTFGFNRWTKLCKKKGVRPVYGVEIAVVTELGSKKPVTDYWTFLAKTSLRDLHDIISTATLNPGKEPCLTYEQAVKAKGLIKISGERTQLQMLKPSTDFYIGLAPSTPLGLVHEGVKRKFKFALTSDNYFTNKEDRELYRLALGDRRSNSQTYAMHLCSEKELKAELKWKASPKLIADAKRNAERCLKACTAELKTATMIVPAKPKTLRAMCVAGAKKLHCDLKNPVYKARLDRELKLIKEKQFEDYFYVIADLVSWAKSRMVVGPARGSSCGSLACYLLGITSIDPIPYGLIFERFIDVNRSDLPDIDIDFSDARRHLVFEYAEKKYGEERVARLGTVGMFKPRSALKTVADNLDIKPWLLEPVLQSIIERSSGDSRALQQLEDTLRDTPAGSKFLDDFPEMALAGKLEGHPANASQHAAGIVITQEPVRQFVAMDMRTKSIMCDKKDAEDYNLLKIDALGLTQLSVFERTLELIGHAPVSGWLETIPLDDPFAFSVLNNAHWSGVFQFMGGALQSLVKQVTITELEDLVAITALARPGPIMSGAANSWCRRKEGKEKVSYPHPLFEPYLKGTLGVVMYQEQVMEIGRNIGDLSWEDVTALRKAMSKSLGKEFFDKYGDKWKSAAAKKGIPQDVLTKVWDDMCAYGSWAFNRSHSVAYGIISYWCCWFKAHHPLEFAAATLDAEQDPDKQIALLRELASEGVRYVAVDAKHSTDRWSVAGKGKKRHLVGPLSQIKGVGAATVKEIMDARTNKKPIRSSLAKKLANAKTEIDTLFPIRNAITAVVGDIKAAGIATPPTDVAKVQCGTRGEVVVLGVARRIAPLDENEEVRVAKREQRRPGSGKLRGKTRALNLFIKDDTDDIFCKVDRFSFDRLGADVVNRGKPGKALYAIKGTVPPDFRMIKVTNIKYLGDIP